MNKTVYVLISYLTLSLVTSTFAPSARAIVSDEPVSRCVRAGCSGQLCLPFGTDGGVTTCAFRPEYACYKQAACETNNAGQCAFTITPSVRACLDDARPTAWPEASPAVSPSPTVLVADLNNDGRVNLIDYSIMVNDLFKTGPNLPADINKDGKVNLIDYSILVTNLST